MFGQTSSPGDIQFCGIWIAMKELIAEEKHTKAMFAELSRRDPESFSLKIDNFGHLYFFLREGSARSKFS